MGKQPVLNGFCKTHSGFESRLEALESDRTEQWEVIDKLRNRLPAWATLTISLLTFALGAVITYATFAVKLSHAMPK